MGNCNEKPGRHEAKGFTLIELLVVIAIIAILMGILMPALKKAKNQAQSSACQGNLKNFTLAVAMYAQDYDDMFCHPGSCYFSQLSSYPGEQGGRHKRWCNGDMYLRDHPEYASEFFTYLKEARAQLSTLRAKGAKKEAPWRSRVVAGLQAAALLIVLTAQLAAVTSLRSRNGSTVPIRNETKRNDTPKRNVAPEQSTDDFDASVETVAAEIRSLIPSFGSQTKLAKHYGIRPANITAVLNHKERKETGGEIISAGGLAKIVEAMG